jgi:hypothetical protein
MDVTFVEALLAIVLVPPLIVVCGIINHLYWLLTGRDLP